MSWHLAPAPTDANEAPGPSTAVAVPVVGEVASALVSVIVGSAAVVKLRLLADARFWLFWMTPDARTVYCAMRRRGGTCEQEGRDT